MKGRIILLFAAMLLSVGAFSQRSPLKLNFSTYDFGEVNNWKNQAAVFSLTNTGKNEVMFLPTYPKDDILVELPERKIQPGESFSIEVYYFTGKLGEFRKSVSLYTNVSKDPINLTVKGNILSLDPGAFIQCPGFAPKPESASVAEQKVKVIDKNTKEPIDEAVVTIGAQQNDKQYKTDRQGLVKEKLAFGLYHFSAEKYGYEPAGKTLYLNKTTGTVLLELEPVTHEASNETWETYREQFSNNREQTDEEDNEGKERHDRLVKYGLISEPAPPSNETQTQPKAETTPPEEVKEEEPEVSLEEPVDENEENPAEPEYEETTYTLNDEPDPALAESIALEKETDPLSVDRYNPNNIVFLIDVSSSMKKENKLPLLKTSMKKLAQVLRKVDLITVITYSSSAHVALSSTTADNKEQIITLIDSLTPAGWTHGVKGIQTAYDMIEANFLNGGNNQVILATDGLFNNPNYSEHELFSLVRDKTQEGIILSVIGFGDDENANKLMKKLADRGNGSFLKIENEHDASQVLVDEIKLHSQKQ